jgi:DNA-cytosine methyltransferase
MRVLSLFDGVSCARVALEKCGIPIEAYYASEIDKYAIQISSKNYPDIIHVGDVTKLKGEDFKDIDLLIGGSPCTDLSICKKDRQGLKGNHSSLFWEYVRLLNEIKPKYFVLENVESMPKADFDIITKTLKVAPMMLNAALLSAQNRKRFFWTNIEVFSLPEDKKIFLKDILQKEVDPKYIISKKHVLDTLKSHKSKQSENSSEQIGEIISENKTSDFSQGYRVYSPEGKAVTLSANGGGLGSKTGLYCVSSNQEIEESLVAPNGKAIKINDIDELQVLKEVRSEIGKKERSELRKIVGKDTTPRSKDSKEYIGVSGDKANCITTSHSAENFIVQKNEEENENIFATQLGNSEKFGNAVSDSGKAFTLRAANPNGVGINHTIRKLTPIECERLQGLKDDYTYGISDTQRYKCLGNAFNADVVAYILNHINNPEQPNFLDLL